MKKIILGLLVMVLFVPAVVLAQEDADTERPRTRRSGRERERLNFEEIRGEIISVSKDTVTIATGTADQQEEVKIRIPERRTELRGLLAQGLGQKAELQCHKGRQGTMTLARIQGIKGVDVSDQSQPSFGRGMEQEGPGRGVRQEGRGRDMPEQSWGEQKQGKGGQEPGMGGRFGAMAEHLKENPELRQELRDLAQDDPEAFRERIRELMPELHQRQGPDDRQEGGMPGRHGPGMMGQMGQGQGMGPQGHQQGRQGRDRFSPENQQTRKLEQQTRELAQQYRQAEGQEKQELEDKLRDSLVKTFEAKARIQNEQVERLAEQLQKLRDRLESRQDKRKAIIQKRFEQLTGQEDDDELAW